jgi:hypothetical protein
VVRHTVGSRAYHETRCEACRAILSARAHESAASKLRARALEAKLRTARAVAKFRQKYGGTHCARCAAGGTWTGCSCGSVAEYSKPSDCWTCRHDAE